MGRSGGGARPSGGALLRANLTGEVAASLAETGLALPVRSACWACSAAGEAVAPAPPCLAPFTQESGGEGQHSHHAAQVRGERMCSWGAGAAACFLGAPIERHCPTTCRFDPSDIIEVPWRSVGRPGRHGKSAGSLSSGGGARAGSWRSEHCQQRTAGGHAALAASVAGHAALRQPSCVPFAGLCARHRW